MGTDPPADRTFAGLGSAATSQQSGSATNSSACVASNASEDGILLLDNTGMEVPPSISNSNSNAPSREAAEAVEAAMRAAAQAASATATTPSGKSHPTSAATASSTSSRKPAPPEPRHDYYSTATLHGTAQQQQQEPQQQLVQQPAELDTKPPAKILKDPPPTMTTATTTKNIATPATAMLNSETHAGLKKAPPASASAAPATLNQLKSQPKQNDIANQQPPSTEAVSKKPAPATASKNMPESSHVEEEEEEQKLPASNAAEEEQKLPAATAATDPEATNREESTSTPPPPPLVPDPMVVDQIVHDICALVQTYGPLTYQQLEFNLPPIDVNADITDALAAKSRRSHTNTDAATTINTTPAPATTPSLESSAMLKDILELLVACNVLQVIQSQPQQPLRYCMQFGVPRHESDIIMPATLLSQIDSAIDEITASQQRVEALTKVWVQQRQAMGCMPSSPSDSDAEAPLLDPNKAPPPTTTPRHVTAAPFRDCLRSLLQNETHQYDMISDPVYFAALRNLHIDFDVSGPWGEEAAAAAAAAATADASTVASTEGSQTTTTTTGTITKKSSGRGKRKSSGGGKKRKRDADAKNTTAATTTTATTTGTAVPVTTDPPVMAAPVSKKKAPPPTVAKAAPAMPAPAASGKPATKKNAAPVAGTTQTTAVPAAASQSLQQQQQQTMQMQRPQQLKHPPPGPPPTPTPAAPAALPEKKPPSG